MKNRKKRAKIKIYTKISKRKTKEREIKDLIRKNEGMAVKGSKRYHKKSKDIKKENSQPKITLVRPKISKKTKHQTLEKRRQMGERKTTDSEGQRGEGKGKKK